MKKTELLDAIRSIVREEVRNQLPALIIESLSKNSTSVPVVAGAEPRRAVQVESAPRPQSKKEVVKYTNNSVLNQVLNETVGGIPTERELEQPSIADVLTPENIGNSPELAAVGKALNRDYRSLLKAVDKKVQR